MARISAGSRPRARRAGGGARAAGASRARYRRAGPPRRFLSRRAKGPGHAGAGRRVRPLARPRELARHAREDVPVERRDAPPVEEPEEAPREESRRLDELGRAVGARLEAELERRLARQAHLRDEQEAARGLDGLHAPEVQRVSRVQLHRMSPAPPDAGTSDEAVEDASKAPQPVRVVPAVGPSDAHDGGPRGVRGGVYDHPPHVLAHRAARPGRVRGVAPLRGGDATGVGPVRLGRVPAQALEREPDGFARREQVLGTSERIAVSWHTTGLTNPSASGRAMAAGTGVTRWIQYDDRRGVSTGTGRRGVGEGPPPRRRAPSGDGR